MAVSLSPGLPLFLFKFMEEERLGVELVEEVFSRRATERGNLNLLRVEVGVERCTLNEEEGARYNQLRVD